MVIYKIFEALYRLMEREKLESRVNELNDLSDRVKETYREFFEGVVVGKFDSIHNETGKPMTKFKAQTIGDESKMLSAIKLYEEWFSQAEVLVKQYYPERLQKFRSLSEKCRDLITLSKTPFPHSTKDMRVLSNSYFDKQIAILNSVVPRSEISEMKFRKQVKENLALEEVERAQRLFEDDLIMPAGVLAGVALERHLKTLMDEREEIESNFDVDIGEAADQLYDNGIISNTKKKELIHYAGVRNDCAHSDEEIDEIQVEKMIDSVNDFIRRR